MTLPSGSNDFPLGLYKVNIEGKEYTPESIDLPTKATRLIQRYDEFGDPSDFQIRLASEKMTGTIVLQRPTNKKFQFNPPVFNNVWFRLVFQGIIANKKNYGESAPEIPSAGMKIYATGNFGQEGHLFGYITNVKVVRSKSEADKIECGIVIERYSKGVIAMHAKTYGDQSSMFMNPLKTYNEDNTLPHFKDFPNLTSSYKTIPNTLTLADNTNRDQVRNDYKVKKSTFGNNVTSSFCEWTTVGGKRVLRMGAYRANATQTPYGIGMVIKGLKKGLLVAGATFQPSIKNKIRFRIRCLNGSNIDGRNYGTNNSTTRIQFQGQTNINSGAVRYNHSSTFLEADISSSLNYYQNDTFNVRIASRNQGNTSSPTTGWVGCEIEFLDIVEEPYKEINRVCDNTLKNWWLTFPKQLVFMTNYMRYYFNELYWQVAPPKDNAYHKIGYIPADQGTVNIGLPTSDKNNLNAEPKKPEDNNFEVNRVSNFTRKVSSFEKGKNKFSSFIEGWSNNDLSTKGIKIEDYSFDCDTDLPTFSDPYEGTDVKLATADSFSWDSSTRTLSVDATTVTPNSGSAYNPRQVVAVSALPSSLKAKETGLTKVRVSGSLDTFVSTDNTIEIIPAQGLTGTGRWTPTNGTTVIDRLGSFSKEFYLPNNGNYLRSITFKIQEGENIVISNLRVQIVEAPIYLIIGQGFADNSGTSSNPIYPNSMGLQSREKRHIIDPDTSLSHYNGFINDSDNKMTDARHLGDPYP